MWCWQANAPIWPLQQELAGVVAFPAPSLGCPPPSAIAPPEPHGEQQGPVPAMNKTMLAMRAMKYSDFGENEVMCKELAGLLDEENTKAAVLAWISDGALKLALSRYGCYVVQQAIDVARGPELERLALQLRPHVVQMCESMHANHVLTKLVEVLPPSAVEFVVEQLKGCEVATAKHRFGCRIWERLIEHCTELQTSASLDAIVKETVALCKHAYGNFVVQHLIEHGSPERRSAVLSLLLPELPILATHRTASHVVQRGLDCLGLEGERAIVGRLLGAERPYTLKEVARTRYGSFVVEQVFNRCSPWARDIFRARLAPSLSELQASQFGDRVAKAMQPARDDAEGLITAGLGGA